jgi:hypothetical protein
VAKLNAESDDDAMGALPIYDDLSNGLVRKTLGLSLDQRKQLQKIADAYRTKMEGPATQSQIETKRARLEDEVRPQIERLLTPQQLATLNDIRFRTTLPTALADPKVQEKMELSREQQESLVRIRQELDEMRFRVEQERHIKASALLTSEQREKLYRAVYGGVLNFDELTPEQREEVRRANHGPKWKIDELTPEQQERLKAGKPRFDDSMPEQKDNLRRMMPGSGNSGSPSKTGSETVTFTSPPAANTLTTTGSGALTFTGSPAANNLVTSGSETATLTFPPANNLIKAGSGMSALVDSSVPKSPPGTESTFLALPVYSDFNRPEVQKELKRTAQEKAKLREIVAMYVAEHKRIDTEFD